MPDSESRSSKPPKGGWFSSEIEIKVSEQYLRRKRNLLIGCSIALVIGLATDHSVKIPSVGDSAIAPSVAGLLLLIANIYLLIEFLLSFARVRLRNVEAVAHLSGDELAPVLNDASNDLKVEFDRIIKQVEILLDETTDLGSLDSRLQEILSSASQVNYLKHPGQSMGDWLFVFRGQLNPSMNPDEIVELVSKTFQSRLESEVRSAVHDGIERRDAELSKFPIPAEALTTLQTSCEALSADVKSVGESTDAMRQSFTRLSAALSRAQRFEILWLDLIAPVVLFGVAAWLSLCPLLGDWVGCDCIARLKATTPAVLPLPSGTPSISATSSENSGDTILNPTALR